MIKEIQVRLDLEEEKIEGFLEKKAIRLVKLSKEDVTGVVILKKSIDSRPRTPVFNYKVAVYTGEDAPKKDIQKFDYKDVSKAKPVHIIGFGPAGMFAALRCIELGYKPIIFERGKDVQKRRRDIKAINQDHIVNNESNYCFGEGGAGTYSDGKLYTRSLKRGDVRRVFENLVYHGATDQILIDAHPHIGTNKLPKVVQNIRETILKYGGEVHFETKLTNFTVENHKIKALQVNNNKEVATQAVILATGHSARDIFELLHKKNIEIKAKSFAMGLRIEHPQQIIDTIQYNCESKRDNVLPAASYSLVEQVKNRGVYSFCMCPGGFIVPAATGQQEVVVNGMSPSRRDSKYANSGIVVEININEDIPSYDKHGPLKGLQYQKDLEKLAFTAGGRTQTAPAQRLTDFVSGKLSTSLNETSYQPGLKSAPLHSLLPSFLGSRLRKGLKAYDKRLKGYFTEQANVVGVESRTSSPVNIPRTETLQHTQIQGLFPCGEGGGYAGGIVSAAMDGERCAEAAIKTL